MTWQLLFFAVPFTAFVWHIVSDTGDDDPDGCADCAANIKHTHKEVNP